eukprot:gnl/MRDRNA2_/MRDRNA2_99502_c0_seq1.p1 gnl/MRDRNA2_/MRDRNA2_99502_c0~~gnl/MRDRNA2_/MRDRNA2_99502_c0_seq1.p1  ORF type:complete len:171 (+),score=34.16 gnl/MRDRNA2_/MRDRNA2_99502_c0_seq1:95-607(+)
MVKATSLLGIISLLTSISESSSMGPLKLSDYLGQYYFGGDTNSGSILVTEAGKTMSGAQYNAPYSDLQDFPKVVRKDDLKDALWVWLPGSNRYNGEGWYHHDTIYQVDIKSPTQLVGYTGDMQRTHGGQPSPNQGKAALQINLKNNALVMDLGGGFGHESWVHFLPSVEA